MANLEAKVDPVKKAEIDARRRALEETARKKQRENDVEEGSLIPADWVADEIRLVSRTVREQSRTMAEEIRLKLALEGRAAEVVGQARRSFLKRFDDVMRSVDRSARSNQAVS